MRFRQIEMTGQILGKGGCIQYDNNEEEMEEFGCDVCEGVSVWHEESYGESYREDVNPGDWVIRTTHQMSVYPVRDFHKKFELI